MSSTATIASHRGARLEARISRTQKSMFERAASLSGRTLTEFVVATVQEAATKVIEDHETIRLTQAEQTAFVKALLDPSAPSKRLRKTYESYKRELQP